MTVKYILSAAINYDLLICDDAGYGYAAAMGWLTVGIDNIDINDKVIFAVDNRITADEADQLEIIIRQNPDVRFLLKIVDPFWHNEEHFYYRFLSKMANCSNTLLLSVYTPAELTADIVKKYSDRFIHLPYPYLISKEVNSKHKKGRILISGSLNELIYPYRYSIWKKVTRSWLRLFFFSILKHPGYAELSDSKRYTHNIIKQNYVQYLSRFKYLLLCPSRCGLELLKFNECAYAGCMPVGQAPDSYPSYISDLFMPLNPDSLLGDVLHIIKQGYKPKTVESLRDFLRETRSPEKLNNILKKFILENSLHTS